MTDKCDKWDFATTNKRVVESTSESDDIETLRQFLILRRETFDDFADRAIAAFGRLIADRKKDIRHDADR